MPNVSFPTELLVVFAVTVFTGGTVTAMAWRRRPEPGAAALAAVLAAATWWVLAYAGEIAGPTLAIKLFWARMQWFGSAFMPVAWLVFAFRYTGRSEYTRLRHLAAFSAVPAATVVLVWTNGSHHLIRESVRLERYGDLVLLEQTYGPWYGFAVSYAALLMIVGTLVFLQLFTSDWGVYKKQAAAIIVAAVAPLIGTFLFVRNLSPWPGFDPTPFSFSVSGVAAFGALYRYKLLEFSPASRRRARDFVLEGMDDGVLVVDRQGHLIDVNRSAAAILDVSQTEVLGVQATSVVPEIDDLTSVDDTAEDIIVRNGGQKRYYDLRVTILRDEFDRVVGRIAVLRDVTERALYEQRLQVLNRVLRHNLRNEMNIVYGYADLLELDSAADRDLADRIKEKAMDIVEMGDKARRITDFIEQSGDDPPCMRAPRLLERSAAEVAAEFPDAAFDVDVAVGDDRYCNPYLGSVVEVLVENAAEHNPSDAPRVWVDARVDDDHLVVAVADDGPGIGEQERSVIESAAETDLMHGSGLGLWLAYWGAQTLGGTLEFGEREGGGSVVTVRVPLADPDDGRCRSGTVLDNGEHRPGDADDVADDGGAPNRDG